MSTEELNKMLKKCPVNTLLFIKINSEEVEKETNRELFSKLIEEKPDDILCYFEKKLSDENQTGVIIVEEISEKREKITLHARHISEIHIIEKSVAKAMLAKNF
ncbi:MAG: hypothetical protein PHD51_01155 [Patescibacteria group bacterium]|nr:hypothetical protein [Patescibacteria group bacterium]MDD5490532.1 hypothetical protein [Patescibacteria group bacterium]